MAESIMSWPDCLGVFDEESCRFFLRELGLRIVQFYPFSVGMEEVFTQIIDQYGFDGAADALSVLHELLEDDSTAAGDGDDGDIWRSWRHCWRHRNDNVHNPHLPRVRGRLLPPATSTRIRLLKAANYVASQSIKPTLFDEPPDAIDNARSYGKHLDLLADQGFIATKGFDPAGINHNELLQQGMANTRAIKNDSHSQNTSPGSFEPVEEQSLLASTTSGTVLDDAALDSPQKFMPAPRRHVFQFNLLSPGRRRSAASPTGQIANLEETMPGSLDSSIGVNKASITEKSSKDEHMTAAMEIGISEKTLFSQRLLKPDKRYSLPSDFGSVDIGAHPSLKRATHRQARMIDGALIQGETLKGTCTEPNHVKASEKMTNDFSDPILARPPLRTSWLQNIFTRIQGNHTRSKHKPLPRKPRSSFVDCGFGPPKQVQRVCTITEPAAPRVPEMRQTSPFRGMGFDGTFDFEESHNKPLPMSPNETLFNRPSLQSETERAFFAPDNSVHLSNSAYSFPIFDVTKAKEQDELRSLVSATMSGPAELPPRDEGLRYTFHSSTATPSEPRTPTSIRSFAALAKQNPFQDHGEPSSPCDVSQHHVNKVTSTIWPFRDRSITRDGGSPGKMELEGDQVFVLNQHVPMSYTKTYGELDEEARRGRQPFTPPTSPSKARFIPDAPSTTSRPRSRSPVKKLIGMVKSMSTNQITAEAPSPQMTPSSTNKRRWKELSNKLRNGFLTADLEQLEQETLMETYTAASRDNSMLVTTPPTTHTRPAFPVSIKSSGQSKLWSELEYMLLETCNSFLKEELKTKRLSRESIVRVKQQWQARNRPQIIEFYYDQATQYELIIANLRSIKLYSDYAHDPIMLNSVLHQWKILIRELSVKTLCMPDSIVRRWLHDGRRVLELLGASQVTLTNMDKLTTLCMAVIGSAEKERARSRMTQAEGAFHQRSFSEGSQTTLHSHEQALLGAQQPLIPPLPVRALKPVVSPTTSSRKGKKITTQALQNHLRSNAPGRTSVEAERYVFTHGNGKHVYQPKHRYSRSQAMTALEERAQMMEG